MRTRTRLAVGAAVVLLAIGAGLLYAVFNAPLYLFMTHQPRDTSALFSDKPQVVAHRGWSGAAPENTLAAFRKAAAAGYWIELDVTLAKTGEIVVIHDDTVDRTTPGTGAVADMDWAELSTLDAGSWYDPAFADERLPTLDLALAAIPPSSVVLIELKTGPDKASLPKAVAAAVQRANRADRVLVISFDPFMLEQLRLTAPELFRGQLVADYADSDLAWYEKRALQNLAFTDNVQQDVVLWQHDLIDKPTAARMRALGYPLFAWTVNEPVDIERMKALGVRGILTDHPDRVP